MDGWGIDMRYLFIFLVFICSGCVAQLFPVQVSGVVKNQKTGKPIPKMQVSVLEIRRSSFMILPETVEKGSDKTNDDGKFFVEGDVSQQFLVELESGICWLPFREVYDIKKDQEELSNIVIYTEKIPGCQSNAE